MSFSAEDAVAVHVVAVGDQAVRMTVEGELDLASATELEALIERELSSGKRVVLDLSMLGFIDCSGLRAILRATEEAQRNGGELLRTASLPDQARRLIELAGVEGDLPAIAGS
jgi:stage II sporulation protein AA (anti-sigma F factor antagonist)